MHIEIDYAGQVYASKETNEGTVEECMKSLWEHFPSMDKLKIELKDGGWLIIGKGVLQTAVIRILP